MFILFCATFPRLERVVLWRATARADRVDGDGNGARLRYDEKVLCAEACAPAEADVGDDALCRREVELVAVDDCGVDTDAVTFVYGDEEDVLTIPFVGAEGAVYLASAVSLVGGGAGGKE